VLSAEGKVLVGPLDFTLEAGTRTALVISGAGKSSLVNALLGFAPIAVPCASTEWSFVPWTSASGASS
jgi:ABC-type transport system involved in cytochrome bd biosynthesis fused ATPase/permease subunit